MADSKETYDLFGPAPVQANATTATPVVTALAVETAVPIDGQIPLAEVVDSPSQPDEFSAFADSVTTFDPDGRIHLSLDAYENDYDLTQLQQRAGQIDEMAERLRATNAVEQSVPVMNICILIVGTRGDVQPFVGIAKRLQEDGHRVRLATHAVYRDFVMEHGVEFYPLGGDPKELAAYMVKTGGHLIPYKYENITKDVPRNMKMLDEIIKSTWPAVSAPDPDALGKGIPGRPFQAQAIISNPVTYGHIHVAERLGVPLHIMFPQPWVPTVAFPHPLSNLPYDNVPQKKNYLSYKLVDLLMWQGTEGMINKFRVKTLGLRKLRKGDHGRDLLLDLAIPHAFMWSPALVPKPSDWGGIYDVIGTVQLKEAGSNYTPTPELEAFLGNDGGPIFVGFGSMVLAKPQEVTKMIIEAAKRAGNVRVLIQSSWSDMAGKIEVPSNIFFLGNCPHDWLMPRVSAVVHHGGAGTTAAGLLAGKPTFIVPFFGDQPFWGRAVVNAGVGVEPCPISKFTADKLHEAFVKLQSPQMRECALALRDVMQQEDGVGEAVRCFYKHLPLGVMSCQICETQLATKWSQKDRIRMCAECEMVITARKGNSVKHIRDYQCVDYESHGPDSTMDGVASGAGAMIHEVGSGWIEWFTESKEGYKKHGAVGAVVGLTKGTIKGFVYRPIKAAVIFADHVATGRHNAARGADERKVGSLLLDNTRVAHTSTMRDDETTFKKIKMKKETPRTQVAVYQVTADDRRNMTVRYKEIRAHRKLSPMDESGALFPAAPQAVVPKMSICMLAVGSWDDGILQFVAIGQRLLADGHRVRIATHEQFRQRITSRGLEFYPLGGQPTTLSSFLEIQHTIHVPDRTFFGSKGKTDFPGSAELKALVFSLWPACTQADPFTPAIEFHSDVIIAQPQVFGQAFVAERLGVPLHCMSTSPCDSSVPPSLHSILDDFRAALGLSSSTGKKNLLTEWRIRHSYLWNACVMSKPLEAGDGHCVAGFVEPHGFNDSESQLTEQETMTMLQSFVMSDTTPVLYVGLAVGDWDPVAKEQLLHTIQDAASRVNARVIFQTTGECATLPVLFSSKVVLQVLASTPVAMLKPFTVGAVHSGDAASTAAWLSAGVPSCVIARGASQRAWGQAIVNAGVGIEPLDLAVLATSIAAAGLSTIFQRLLQDQSLGESARRLARSFSSEAAIETAVHHLYSNLPIEAMRCDLDPNRVAHVYDVDKELKLSYEAHMVVQDIVGEENKLKEKHKDTEGMEPAMLLKYRPIKYSKRKFPRFTLRPLAPKELDRYRPSHRWFYEVPKHEERARLKAGGLTGLTLTRRGFVSRKKSIAATVLEAPTNWSSPDAKQKRIAAIHAKYESLLRPQSR